MTAVPGSDSQRAQALALKLDPEYPVPGAELDRRFGGPKIGFDTTYRQVRVTLAFDFASHTLGENGGMIYRSVAHGAFWFDEDGNLHEDRRSSDRHPGPRNQNGSIRNRPSRKHRRCDHGSFDRDP